MIVYHCSNYWITCKYLITNVPVLSDATQISSDENIFQFDVPIIFFLLMWQIFVLPLANFFYISAMSKWANYYNFLCIIAGRYNLYFTIFFVFLSISPSLTPNNTVMSYWLIVPSNPKYICHNLNQQRICTGRQAMIVFAVPIYRIQTQTKCQFGEMVRCNEGLDKLGYAVQEIS